MEAAKICERFRHVVGAIVTLRDGLSIASLARLLEVPFQSVELCLRSLHSVLDVPSHPDQKIRLLHPSFHDFLVNRTRCYDLPFYVSERDVHAYLFSNCVLSMKTSLKRNMCGLTTPTSSPHEVNSGTMTKRFPSHAQYACQYFLEHLFRWRPTALMMLDHMFGFMDFITRSLLFWIEAMSLMGKVTQAIDNFKALRQLCQDSFGQQTTLLMIVQDAERFILANRRIIEDFPLQVYLSALMFSPIESKIRQSYANLLPFWLTSFPTAVKRWGNCSQTLEIPDTSVTSISFSLDGRYLACGSSEGKIRLWNATTGELRSDLEHPYPMTSIDSIAFSCSDLLASASSHGVVVIWDPITGKVVQSIDVEYIRTRICYFNFR